MIPLACIEAIYKVQDGDMRGWNGWEIHELRDEAYKAELAEVFCSEDPYSIQESIEECLPLFRQAYPRLRARAFVWYLHDGPLVTFYKQKDKRAFSPVEILCRFLMPWKTYPEAQPWHGTYEDILEQMKILYPY